MTVITDHMHFPMFGNSLLDVLCCKGDYFKVCFIGFLILKKKKASGVFRCHMSYFDISNLRVLLGKSSFTKGAEDFYSSLG
jgi:hypothetical protein